MKQALTLFFAEEKIEKWSFLPFDECHVTLPKLLEADRGFSPKSAILFLIPYFGGFPENLSAYAAPEDYHLFVKVLWERLSPKLTARFPLYRFRMYVDHSPIDERHAAVRAGLGVFGKNGLLLTPEFSSFQFIGEILTDAPTEEIGSYTLFPLRGCENCGRCLSACPTGVLRGEGKDCLSAITQRKGELSAAEKELMKQVGTAWGCDECQRVCPYTTRALTRGTLYSPIPFFGENRIEMLTPKTLSTLDMEAFRRRAFAWRGRAVAERNASLFAEIPMEGEKNEKR